MKIETRDVMRDAYKGSRVRADVVLTHATEVDSGGRPVRVLCDGVKRENIADVHGDEPESANLRPTCPRCDAKDPRFA